MAIEGRPYRAPADLVRMRELLIVGKAAGIPASYMHPGELYWMTYYPPNEEANRRDIRVWEFGPPAGGGELAAWGIYCALEGTFDLFVHPSLYGTVEHAAIMGDYMGWAEGRAREAGLDRLAPFWVMDYDTVTDGRLYAAVSSIWYDEVNRIGLFEPVATHPDFQRRGLGKAVMAEGLRRLRAGGMRCAILGTDPTNEPAMALYRAMGFSVESCFVFYRRGVG